jgi:hypothetical protein
MLTKRHLLAVLSVLLLLVVGGSACSCSNDSPLASSPNLNDAVITLERTLCYGSCPAYKLTVRGNGTVTWEGKKFVKTMGKVEGSISPEQFKQLVSEFDQAKYLLLNDGYTQISVTDAPYATTSITVDGKTKSVRHYLGDASAPQRLTSLESKIDEIVNSDQWIK